MEQAKSILDWEPPSEEELREICSAKYAHVGPFYIDRWPASVAALSMPTKMVQFDAAVLRDLWEDWDIGPSAQAVADRLDAEMGWNEYFIRLNSRSPKDVIDRPVTCSGKQAVLWMVNSERCLDDVSLAFYAQAPIFVCLREPRHFHPDGEFRCFAKDGKMLGLSRYLYNREPSEKLPTAAELMDAAAKFYEAHLAAHYPTVVFDLYAPGSPQELLIELNPYGMSDPCLFETYEAVEQGGVRL